jgi:hypothetical protein
MAAVSADIAYSISSIVKARPYVRARRDVPPDFVADQPTFDQGRTISTVSPLESAVRSIGEIAMPVRKMPVLSNE